MSEPIRSTSVSPFAARPMVQSRRVSLRVGSFGLTYSTERLLWDGAQAGAPAAAETPQADPPPVDAAPAVESDRPQSQAEASTFPLDLEAARKRALWAAAQQQVASQQTLEGQVGGEAADLQLVVGQGMQANGSDPVSASQGQDQTTAGQPSVASADGAAVPTGQPGRNAALVQAMRHATQAYQACEACFASPQPMLQAVA